MLDVSNKISQYCKRENDINLTVQDFRAKNKVKYKED